MWENAYIWALKIQKLLKWVLDPGHKMLTLLVQLNFTTSTTFGLRRWAPPPHWTHPGSAPGNVLLILKIPSPYYFIFTKKINLNEVVTIKQAKWLNCNPVADLRGTPGRPSPSPAQFLFDYMQSFGKFVKIVCWHSPGWSPPSHTGNPGSSPVIECSTPQISLIQFNRDLSQMKYLSNIFITTILWCQKWLHTNAEHLSSCLEQTFGVVLCMYIQFLSFSCGFRQKSCQIMVFCSKLVGWRPMGNPGSIALDRFDYFDVSTLNCCKYSISTLFFPKDLVIKTVLRVQYALAWCYTVLRMSLDN